MAKLSHWVEVIYEANVFFVRALCRTFSRDFLLVRKAQALQYLECSPWTFDTHWGCVHA